jgi:hypothetical protein
MTKAGAGSHSRQIYQDSGVNRPIATMAKIWYKSPAFLTYPGQRLNRHVKRLK